MFKEEKANAKTFLVFIDVYSLKEKQLIDDAERERRWHQFGALALAQQLSLYPRGYLSEDAPHDRLLETVERLEEDFTGKARAYSPRSVTLKVCDPIEVPAKKETSDEVPLLDQLEQSLSDALDIPADL